MNSDMAILWDPGFKKYVQFYAQDEELFFRDFAVLFGKLLALGGPGQTALASVTVAM